ncbi:MAG: hypothetical protein Q9M26_06330 [Mariprofundales bacterium]|nr:hypothetical protein [Mariprofundales bacterium]
MQVSLNIDGGNFPLGCHDLAEVISAMADTSDNMQAFDLLASHPSRKVRIEVAKNENISEKIVESFFASGDEYIIESLIANRNISQSIKSHYYNILLSSDDNLILKKLANQLTEDDFDAVNKDNLKKLVNHSDPDIRGSLAENRSSPPWILNLLAEDDDPDVRSIASMDLHQKTWDQDW